jgi:hypothetical protein
MDFSSSGKPTPQYIEGQPGYGLDVESTIALVKQAIEAGQYQTTLTPTLTTIQPSITLAEVQANFSQIGKFTTTYSFKGTAEDTEQQRAYTKPCVQCKKCGRDHKQVIKTGASGVLTSRWRSHGGKRWKEATVFSVRHDDAAIRRGVCQTINSGICLLQAYPYIKSMNARGTQSVHLVDMGLTQRRYK